MAPFLDIDREIANIRNRPDGVWLASALQHIRDAIQPLQVRARTPAAITQQSITETTQNLTTILQESLSGAGGGTAIAAGINTQTGTSYTLQTGDAWQIITFANAAAIAVSLPTSLGYFYCSIQNLNASGGTNVTLTPTSGAINGASSITLAPGEGALIFCNGSFWNAIVAYTQSGGGGGTLQYPDNPPSSPSSWDDEFNAGSSLNAKWSTTGTDPYGSATTAGITYDVNTTWPSWLRGVFTSTYQNLILSQAFAPSGAFTVTIKISVFSYSNYGGINMQVADSAGSNSLQLGVNFNSSLSTTSYVNMVNFMSKKAAGSWTFNIYSRNLDYFGNVYLHLQNDGSGNWRGWSSPNGITWIEISTGSGIAFSFTPAYLWLELTNPNTMWMGVDWVRVNWITLT